MKIWQLNLFLASEMIELHQKHTSNGDDHLYMSEFSSPSPTWSQRRRALFEAARDPTVFPAPKIKFQYSQVDNCQCDSQLSITKVSLYRKS